MINIWANFFLNTELMEVFTHSKNVNDIRMLLNEPIVKKGTFSNFEWIFIVQMPTETGIAQSEIKKKMMND